MKPTLLSFLSWKRILALTTLFLLLFICIFIARYKSGKHYSPFYVDLPPSADIRVFTLSPHGSVQELIRHSTQKGIFFYPDYTSSPAASMAIAYDPGRQPPETLTVTLGESHIGIGQNVKLVRNHSLPGEFAAKLPANTANTAIYSKTANNSFLPNIPKRSFNWAGDILFLITITAQSIFLTAAIALTAHILRQLSFIESPRKEGRLELILTAVPTSFCFLYILYHVYSTGTDFLTVVNPAETILVTVVAIVLLTIPSLWAHIALFFRNLSNGQLAFIGLTSLLIVRVVVSGSFPSHQAGDYGTYTRLGNLIVDGNWQSLNNGFYLDRVYAERALLFGAPVAFVSRYSSYAPHLINFCLISSLTALLFRSIAKEYGRAAGTITAIALNLHPDILFGGHLCRHDNPSLLYLTLILLLTTQIREGIWFASGNPLKLVCKTIAAAAITGCLLGLIEVQRSYLPFLVLTISIVLFNPVYIFSALQTNRSAAPKLVLCGTLAILTTVCISAIGLSVSTNIRSYLTKKSGEFTTRTLTDNLCAIETKKPADWQSIHGWLANYPPAIPNEYKNEFSRRKLLYEKFTEIEHIPSHLLQKAKAVTGLRSAIRMSGAQEPYEQFPFVFFVPFASAKFCFGFCSTLILLFLSVSRVLKLSTLPPKAFESSFLVFSIIFIALVLVLSEAAEQYDLFLAIPLAINAGVVLSTALKIPAEKTNAHSPPHIQFALNSLKKVSLGNLLLIILAVIYYGVATFIQTQPKLTFARAASEMTTTGPGICENQSDRITLRFDTRRISSGATSTATAKFARKDFSSDTLRFFISLDQRNQHRIWGENDSGCQGLEYELYLDQKKIYSGPLDELKKPLFATCEIPDQPSFEIKIQLRATADVEITAASVPTIAIEYIH